MREQNQNVFCSEDDLEAELIFLMINTKKMKEITLRN